MAPHRHVSVMMLLAMALLLVQRVSSSFCHLFYVNADTNLETYQIKDMQEVLNLEDSTFTALLYMDRNNADTSSSSSAMQNLFYSNGQATTREISTTIYAKMETNGNTRRRDTHNKWVIYKNDGKELDTTSKPTVLEFVRWAWGKCSSSQYKVLSFNMHGGGVSGISGDDSNGHSSLSISELKSVFQTLADEGKKFSIIGFDTCLMSAYSLGQVLWDLADYLVASEPTEPGYGWDYRGINTKATTPLLYAKSIVNAFQKQNHGPNELVVTDLKKFGELLTPSRALMVKMKNGVLAGDQNFVDSITRARENSAEYEAVWETFQDWFDVKDSSGAEEKSQMDVGSFWRHLMVQCPGLAPDIQPLLAKLNAAVLYKEVGNSNVECTGPGCAAGVEGIALWFKKRRWMLGAYKHYQDAWHRSKQEVIRQIGPFVDSRLEKELRYGLPEWYQFLSAFYQFEPKTTSVDTCGGTFSGHQNDEEPTTDANSGALAACSSTAGQNFCNLISISGDTAKTVVQMPAYENNLYGTIKVKGPALIQFTRFALEAVTAGRCYDYLRVGKKRYCGTVTPPNLNVATGKFETMTFKSDGSVTSDGFYMVITGGAGATSYNGPRRRRSRRRSTPTPPACPSDGRGCSTQSSCTCGPGMMQKTFEAVGGGYCYGCVRQQTSSPQRRRCPGPDSSSCSKFSTCPCNSGMYQQMFSCGSGCQCYGCEYSRRLQSADTALNATAKIVGEGERCNPTLPPQYQIRCAVGLRCESESGMVGAYGTCIVEENNMLENSSTMPHKEKALPETDPADLRPIEAEASFPPAVYTCPETQGLCNVRRVRFDDDMATPDYYFDGDIADWVTNVDLFLGTDVSNDARPDIIWTMELPTIFTSRTTFRSRWPGRIPYIVSATDHCQAFVRVDGAVDAFAERTDCLLSNITLQAPVLYFKTQQDIDNQKHQSGVLEQVVRCQTLEPVSTLVLKIPATGLLYDHTVSRIEGGFVQPIVYTRPAPDATGAKYSKKPKFCNSKAPFPWSDAPALNLVEVGSDQMPENVKHVWGSLVTNEPGENGRITQAMEKKRYTFKIDPITGNMTHVEEGIELEDEPLAPGERPTGFWYLAIPVCCCLLCSGVAAYCILKDLKASPKKAPKSKKRAVAPLTPLASPRDVAPTPAIVAPTAPLLGQVLTTLPAASPVLTAPPVYVTTPKAPQYMPVQTVATPIYTNAAAYRQMATVAPTAQTIQTSAAPVASATYVRPATYTTAPATISAAPVTYVTSPLVSTQ